jgi:lipopolysaccharide transport system ATP-binding protein
MYVRLAFAVAAHLEPEILIVDEVLAVGDAQFQKKCLGKMGDIAEKDGRTVLFVSHNMNALFSLCQSTILIDQGKLDYQGDTVKVIEKYLLVLREENDYSDLSQYRVNKSLDSSLIYFTKIKLMKDRNQFLFKEPINIEISFFSTIKSNNLSIGGGIFNSMGNAIGTFITKEICIEKDESKSITFSIINLHLSPAIYTMAFSITKGNLTNTHIDNYDVVVGILQLEVLPFNDQEKISVWNPAWGNIVLNDYIIKQEPK